MAQSLICCLILHTKTCLTFCVMMSEMSPWIFPAGDFSDPEGSSGWTDTSIGNQGWVLFKNSTSKGTKTLCQLLITTKYWFPYLQREKKKNLKKKPHNISFVFHRGVPVCRCIPRPAADWGPDTDPPPGPLGSSLHPALWFCANWESRTHRYLSLLVIWLLTFSWTQIFYNDSVHSSVLQVSSPSGWLTAC